MLAFATARGRLLLSVALAIGLPAGSTWAAERHEAKPESTSGLRKAPSLTRPKVWDFGCAEDYFPASQRLARQIRLRMPIPANDLLGVVPEPGVVHSDLDAAKAGSLTQCSAWGNGHLCYNGHEGTDYMLGGAFLQMGSVGAVAAARGKVFYTREDQFDGCHVTTDIAALLDDDNGNNVVCPDPDNPEGRGVNDANRVSVCHADGTVTEYLHLMRNSIPPDVVAGGMVQCGQAVGTLGSSGKSSGPHLHFSVLVPASRASQMGHPNGQGKRIGDHDYVYLDPYHADVRRSLWTDQEWNYAGNFENGVPVPSLEHPNGHATTLICPHLVPPHDGHAGPRVACLHPEHPNGHQVTLAGITATRPCTHPLHENGHATRVACLHAPVPAHPGGHPGPVSPCTHITLEPVAISALTLPGPRCDRF